MADIAREYLENSLENEYILNTNQESSINDIETHDKIQESESIMTHSSSFVLARNDSQLSGDVDRWMGDSPTEVPLRGISAIFNSAGLLVAQLGRLCSHIRCQLRHMSETTRARDIFATAMDVILVVYAVGFLILSMYQASLIG
ncbi:unnamed protein product [Pieris brassicae]|uniref:Uncharacterized protein n=1 Tax=Pieris brassicae TaxID=7116 RepID=A0A9P0X0J4_PIEBR|nr:unnamed protein product [Pieris brassicae]